MLDQASKVYLIGLNPMLQFLHRSTSAQGAILEPFLSYLRAQILDRRVTLLAEVGNEEGLHLNQATDSPLRDLATQLSLEHRFCDPTWAERLPHSTSENWRQAQWLRRLTTAPQHRRRLLLLPEWHLDSFHTWLSARGYAAEELSRGWGWELLLHSE